MFYAITNNGVIKSKNIKGINIRLKSKIEISEFNVIGRDYVVNLNNKDIDFIQDKKRMSSIPIKNLYKADSVKLLIYLLILMNFIILVRG